MSDLTFEPLDPAELQVWRARSRAEYIDARVSAGDSPAEASAAADASMAQLFPGGRPGPSQLIGHVVADGERVGTLWVGPFGNDPARWWVWDVVIEESRRGRGLGRRTMVLAEELARAHGASTIGLNVFAGNAVARHLYSSLGYEETSVQMRKPLR